MSVPEPRSSTGRALFDQLDLWLTALFAVLAVVAVAMDLPPLVRTVVAVPLVLLLPGHALVSALFPALELPTVERLVVSAGTSIVLAILAGLVLGGLAILQPLPWSVTLAAITIVGVAVGWLRRVQRGVVGPRLSIATMPRLGALMVFVAVLLAADVVVGARLFAIDQQAPVPLQLWMVPSEDDNNEAVLGVHADEDGGPYRIEISVGGELVNRFDVELQPEETWQAIVRLNAELRQRPVVARLFRGDSQSEERYVVLEPGTKSRG